MKKNDLDIAIDAGDYQTIGRIIAENPGKIRKLISRLHSNEGSRLKRTLDAFQVAAKVMDIERLKDIVRRLMWMLNEESGNNCPNAALALGHIAMVYPETVAPHLPILRIYAEDPSVQFRSTIRKSVSIINMALKRSL